MLKSFIHYLSARPWRRADQGLPWARRLGQWGPIVTLGVMLIPVLFYYRSVFTTNTFGFVNDDAIFVSAAKALATGRGYRVISVPYEPAQTKYPPFYPFLLSLVWRLRPDFPGNLKAMMLVTVFSSIAATILIWVYLTRCGYTSKWFALIVVGLAATNVQTLVYSAGVFVEMTFVALSALALLLAEAYESRARAPGLGLLLGAVMGLAFLTRINGITLLAAVGLYLCIGRRWRQMLLPVGVAGLFVLGWMMWVHVNRTTHVETNSVYLTDYLHYYADAVKNEAHREQRPVFRVALSTLDRNAGLLFAAVPREAVGLYVSWYPRITSNPRGLVIRFLFAISLVLMAIGLRKHTQKKWRLLPLYLIMFIAVLFGLPPPEGGQPRYILPVLSFLLALQFKGMAEAGRAIWFHMIRGRGLVRKLVGGASVIPLVGLLVFTLLSYAFSAYTFVTGLKRANTYRFVVESEGLKWVEDNTSKSAVVATVFHAMYYLYTGRKAVLCFPVERPYPAPSQVAAVRRILDENEATYLVLSDYEIKTKFGGIDYASVVRELEREGVMEQVFKSSDGLMNIYQYKVVSSPLVGKKAVVNAPY